MESAAQIDAIASAVNQLEGGSRRKLIAIAGPPASGKSTLAISVQARLTDQGLPCGFVPMDGFHLDNATLEERGLLHRKGAPETFNVAGFKALLERLMNNETVQVPHFDRAKDCVVNNAELITSNQRHVVVEGNYLLLNSGLWLQLAPLWSFKVFLEPPLQVLEKRLISRWVENGLKLQDALRRARENDIPNALLTLRDSNKANADLLLD